MTLVEFLTARLRDDEQVARATDGASWRTTDDQDDFSGDSLIGYTTLRDDEGSPISDDRDGRLSADDLMHIARHDPARVLRDVEAKRRIVAEHASEDGHCRTCTVEDREDAPMGTDWDTEPEAIWVRRPVAYPCPTLRLLALPYADHPDYREEWRP